MIHALAQAASDSDLGWPAALVAIVGLLASTGVLGAFVRLLQAKAKRLEEALDATVEGVESMPDAERKVAKSAIKRTAERKGIEPELAEHVQKKTRRL